MTAVVGGILILAWAASAPGTTTTGVSGDGNASLIYNSATGNVNVDVITPTYNLGGLTIQSAAHNLLYANWTGPNTSFDFYTGRNDLVAFNGAFSGATVAPTQSVGRILATGWTSGYLLNDLTISYFKTDFSQQYPGSLIVIDGYTWQGQDTSQPTNWGVAANWGNLGQVPDALGEKVTFGSPSAGSTVDLVSSHRKVGKIEFLSATGSTLQSSGSRTLTLQNFGTAATIAVAGSHTIAPSLTLSLSNATTEITAGSGGFLNVAGNITESAANKVLYVKPGAGKVQLAGSNTYTGGTEVGGYLQVTSDYGLPSAIPIIVDAGGTLVLGSTMHGHMGDIDVSGTLRLNGANALPADIVLNIGAGGALIFDGGAVPGPVGAPTPAAAVPEPGSLALLTAALAAIVTAGWFKRSKIRTR